MRSQVNKPDTEFGTIRSVVVLSVTGIQNRYKKGDSAGVSLISSKWTKSLFFYDWKFCRKLGTSPGVPGCGNAAGFRRRHSWKFPRMFDLGVSFFFVVVGGYDRAPTAVRVSRRCLVGSSNTVVETRKTSRFDLFHVFHTKFQYNEPEG